MNNFKGFFIASIALLLSIHFCAAQGEESGATGALIGGGPLKERATQQLWDDANTA